MINTYRHGHALKMIIVWNAIWNFVAVKWNMRSYRTLSEHKSKYWLVFLCCFVGAFQDTIFIWRFIQKMHKYDNVLSSLKHRTLIWNDLRNFNPLSHMTRCWLSNLCTQKEAPTGDCDVNMLIDFFSKRWAHLHLSNLRISLQR